MLKGYVFVLIFVNIWVYVCVVLNSSVYFDTVYHVQKMFLTCLHRYDHHHHE